MIMVTKVIGGFVSFQRLDIVIPNPQLPKKEIKKSLVLIEINK